MLRLFVSISLSYQRHNIAQVSEVNGIIPFRGAKIFIFIFIRYSFDGKLYVSGSRDGSIKLWDGISSKCVGTISQAHEGAEVGSVTFSRSGKVLSNSYLNKPRLVLTFSICVVRTVFGHGFICKTLGTLFLALYYSIHWSRHNGYQD